MKYMKMLGLLAVAAAALMAFVGTASATELTSPKGSKLLSGQKIVAESEGATSLDGSVKVSCLNSTVEGEIKVAGGKNANNETLQVSGPITKLTFTNCDKDTVTVLNEGKAGTLSIESLGGNDGTVRSTGAEVTVQLHRTVLGFPVTTHCIYATNNTHIGTLTGTETTKGAATLDIGSAPIPEVETDAACGKDAVWTGNYKVTTPQSIYVD